MNRMRVKNVTKPRNNLRKFNFIPNHGEEDKVSNNASVLRLSPS